ncbi:hypothetical protein U1Q18_045786, partial [Sarracenia purpurea var. burkii]
MAVAVIPSPSNHEENVYNIAKLAEQADGYEEMVEFMEKVVVAVDDEKELSATMSSGE